MKFDASEVFINPSRKFKFRQYVAGITVTLHEDQITFLIMSRSVLLRVRNVTDKSCRENQNKHFRFLSFFYHKIVPFMR
jgi:hypothetical protein